MNLNKVRSARRTAHLARAMRRPLGAAIAMALLLGGTGVNAAPTDWTGNVSSDWTVAGNWNVPPSSDSNVLINTRMPHGSMLDGDDAEISLLTVGASGQGTLDIVHGGSLTVRGSDAYGFGAILGQHLTPLGSMGTVTVSGMGSVLTIDAGTQIGNDGLGFLSVLDGGTANLGLGQAYSETLLGFGNYGWNAQTNLGTGTMTIDGTGSVVNYAGGFNILNGAVTISNGGQLVSHARETDGTALWLDSIGFGVPANPDGSYQGLDGTGQVTIRGDGSAWVSGSALQVGFGGSGNLSILDGGKASFAGFANLGGESYLYDALGGSPVAGLAGRSGTGQVVVSGAGSALTMTVVPDTTWGTGYINIGYDGPGSLTVNEGGTVTAPGNIQVGPQGSLTIGGEGEDGALMAPGTIDTPSVILHGSAARLRLRHSADDYTLAASIAGNGSLRAEEGFTRLSGDSSDFTGDISIDGDATLEVTGKLDGQVHVGNTGTGTLRVTDGGTMHALGGIVLADAPGSRGDVFVSGAGSTFTVDGDTLIGRSGVGSLAVSDGGTINLGLDAEFSEPMIGFAGADAPSGKGMVSVDGNGSTLNYGGGFNLANGSLVVGNGGQLVRHTRGIDGDASWIDVIGYGAPGRDGGPAGSRGQASVTISGAGSAWDSRSQLQMGRGGDAELSILDGGSATFAGAAKLGGITYLYDPATGIRLSEVDGQPGSASVQVSGTGSALTLTAIPDTTWATGSIEIGQEGPGSLTVNEGGTVTAPGGIHLGAMGALTIGSLETDGASVAPGSIDVPTIDFAGPAATLTFRHSGELYLFDAAMSGTGHIDAIGGFTRLTGDSGAFDGTTTIDGGATLSVNGSLGGDILVGADGTLQGTGTVGNVTVDGTLAPGNSPGTLHVDGDLLMRTGSTYEAQIDPGKGISDSVEVAGNVTIQPGTTLKIENLGTEPLAPGANIQLIRTTSGDATVSGQFDNTVGSIGTFLGYGVAYDNGQINIGVTRSQTSFASVGHSAGTQALGAALDGLPNSSPLALVLFSQLDTPEQAATAFDAMAGSMNADLHRMLLDNSRTARDTIGHHLQQAADASDQGTAWWVQAMGHWGSQDGSGDVSRARTNGSGIMVGVDTGIGTATRLGLAAGAGQTSYDMTGQDAHIRNRHVALYGRSALDAFAISYGVASSWHDIHAQRRFAIGSAAQSTDSNRDARTDQAFVDAGYRIGDGKRHVEPFVSVAHAVLHYKAAAERGSVAALVTHGGSDNATFATLGTRWTAHGDSALWYGSLGWRHVFGFDRTVATQSFAAGGPAFNTGGLPMARNAAAIELGARFDMSRRVHFAAGYTGLWSNSASDQGAQLTLTFDL